MNDIIYADVPKDLMKIKTKFLFNLTKRQLCCFGGGALVGVPLYFLTRDALPRTVSMLLMIGAAVLSHPGRAAPHGVHAAHDRRHDTLLSVRAV